ncbi:MULTISPECIES: hypothetical protein [unclassified Modestobacter]|uniref:hypothetical protein n=1 Tax=unclassified Modestobacter TaxID=2643866 RepID=UPI0022AA32D0|nr:MULTISPECIES: hypothetical protein [unclassified Modestobacter]MCZ2826092.1 hypothetical protein [Modestobacter sp. VKM Ac-2981]MCZ2852843.1 hypothetical protein [Modestobacter sp. VKM Ac-2982]
MTTAPDITARLQLEATRSLLRELRELEPLHEQIASLLPANTEDTVEHWWAEPGLPLPDNPAPDRLSPAAWLQLAGLAPRHLRAYRRLRYLLKELQLTCSEDVSTAAEQLLDSVPDIGSSCTTSALRRTRGAIWTCSTMTRTGWSTCSGESTGVPS